MQLTSLDLLYLILAFAIFLIAVMLAIFLWQISQVMRNVEKITQRADNLAGRVEEFVKIPLQMLQSWIQKWKGRKNREDDGD